MLNVYTKNYQLQEKQHVLLDLNKTIYKSKNRLSKTKAVFTCFLYISLTYIREIDDFYKQHVPQRVIYSTSVLYTILNY